MLVKDLLKSTACKVELRKGSSTLFTWIPQSDIRRHLEDEIRSITYGRNTIVVYVSVPFYEVEWTGLPWE